MFRGAKYICCKQNQNATYHRRGFQMLLLLSDSYTGQWISTSRSQMCTWPNTRQSYPAKQVEQVCAAFSNSNFLSLTNLLLQVFTGSIQEEFYFKIPKLKLKRCKTPKLKGHSYRSTYLLPSYTFLGVFFDWEWLENEVRHIKKKRRGQCNSGFILKNPFKIHKLFTNLHNTAWKSNMKILNSSANQVKGCNPYYSWWPCILSVKTDRKYILCDFAQFFLLFFLTTVRSWEVQFLTDKLIVFP